MSIKSLSNKITSKVGKQILTAQKHSPVMLFGIGIVGVGATAVLACQATLKMSAILEEGEEALKKVKETTKVMDGDEDVTEETKKKASFGVKLQTAIKIARLYAPAIVVGVASVGALTGSHIILRKRNAALGAAYAIVHKSFDDYRGRVRDELGAEKDLEFRFGTTEREIVEEGPNGPETRIVKGLDQEAVKASAKNSYARIFDQTNNNWAATPHSNQYFVQMVQSHANDLLKVKGHVFLNDVYDMLGFERTKAGQVVGWQDKPKKDENGNPTGDGYIDFGVWNEGVYKGKEWVNGDSGAFLLDFNVDGVVLDTLNEV